MAKSTKETAIEETEGAVDSTLKKFSELSHKAQLVIKNANGSETQVTKTYWQSVRNSELDRLQGIELLGMYVPKEGGYDIVKIIDDSEVADM